MALPSSDPPLILHHHLPPATMSLFAGTSFLAGANDKPIEEAVTPPTLQIPITGTPFIPPSVPC